MLNLTKRREEKGWSKTELSHRAKLQPALIGQIESGRFKPYPVQLEKMASALGYEGNPNDLLQEVE